MYGKIYLITNIKNGKQYVGQTQRSIEERWSEHVRKAKNHDNHHIGNAILKYGSKDFKIEEIGEASSQEKLDLLEIKTISRLNTMRPNGYNLTEGGLGGSPSIETKEKIRQSKLGAKNPNYQKIWTEEEREHLSKKTSGENNPFYGKKHSTETKKRLSEVAKSREVHPRLGKKASEETKAKLRKSWTEGKAKRSGENHHLFGKSHSEETRRKISEAHKKLEKKTSCIRGHPYDQRNTYTHLKTGRRYCRTCNIESRRRKKYGSNTTNS